MSTITVEILTRNERIASVLRRYWEYNGESFPHRFAALAEELGVPPFQLHALIREGSRATAPDWRCSRCDSAAQIRSRSDYQEKALWRRFHRSQEYVCDVCEQEEKDEIEAEERDGLADRQSIIQKHYKRRPLTPLDPGEHSFTDLVFLLSLVRAGASEDLDWINPVDHLKARLAPTSDYATGMVRRLFQAGLISVHPGSDPTAFVWDEQDEPSRFYLGKVFWTVGLDANEAMHFVQAIEALFRDAFWPQQWMDEIRELWREVLVEETIQYLEMAIGEHRLPFKAGTKTRATFSSILEERSMGQVFYMIWRKTKDIAADYQARKFTSPEHAANSVPGAVQQYSESARAKNWEVTRYQRNYRAPQAVVSQVLFNTALHIGDQALSISFSQIDPVLAERFVDIDSVPDVDSIPHVDSVPPDGEQLLDELLDELLEEEEQEDEEQEDETSPQEPIEGVIPLGTRVRYQKSGHDVVYKGEVGFIERSATGRILFYLVCSTHLRIPDWVDARALHERNPAAVVYEESDVDEFEEEGSLHGPDE
jgi:hypothetical protein